VLLGGRDCNTRQDKGTSREAAVVRIDHVCVCAGPVLPYPMPSMIRDMIDTSAPRAPCCTLCLLFAPSIYRLARSR
jgi:hypothetical protein